MKAISIFICCLIVTYSTVYSQAKSTGKRPNIIFILADDLGYGDIACYGQKIIETPNLDKLAKGGVKFTQFYSGSTVCAPARNSFLTGMHTGHGAIRGNVTVKPEGQVPMPDSVVTFPMLMQQNGYTTAAFGKWSLGFITTSGDPQKKGFDEFYGYNDQTLAHNYYPDHLWHNHERIDLPGNLKYDSVYSADLIHEQAMKFIKGEHNKPFFIYLPYTLPHADIIVPRDEVYNYYVNKLKEAPVETPNSSDNEKHHFDTQPHATFAAMVARLDRYVGDVMKALKEQGLEDNTLVIFTSDNGPHKENGGDPAFFNGNGGLRGIKRDLYEGGIRVPFIAYKKGLTKAGTVNTMPSVLYDLFPTFLELAQIKSTKNIDGLSMLPALGGNKQKEHEYMYWELHESGGKQAVRMGNWKGVKLDVSKSTNSAIELYNLAKDPAEKQNVAARFPQVVKQIEQVMQKAYVPNKDWPLMAGEPNVSTK